MPICVAIVEDQERHMQTLKEYLLRYGEENQLIFKIQTFSNAVTLLEHYTATHDIIFMDIRMPYINGMDAAHRLRALDKSVALIFVTSLTQYAVSGYEVDALDYIVKPINYYDFALKLSRAVKRLPKEKSKELMIPTEAGMIKLDPNDIRYIETQGHHVIYRTLNGDYTQYSTMSKLEEKLSGQGFARCNSCYLVNLRYVVNIKGYVVTLDNCELKISQPRKKKFMQQLMDYPNRTIQP